MIVSSKKGLDISFARLNSNGKGGASHLALHNPIFKHVCIPYPMRFDGFSFGT